jgi:hypothetical protein
MRTVHRIAIAALASLATVVSTGVGAFAAQPGYVTREQFVYDLDRAIGLQPITPAQSDFTDISSSSPYYGYIEAAYQKGYIQGLGHGLFGPTDLLTRAQMAKIEVTALGDTSAAQALMNQHSTFKDDLHIPAWARGYVLEAVQLGLVKGYPNNTFAPGADLTPTDEAAFIRQFVAVLGQGAPVSGNAPSSVVVTASSSSAAVGQMVQLSATVKTADGTTIANAPVSYTANSTNVILSGSQFIASTPGVYTVQATSGGVNGLVTITVYGLPVAIKLVPSGPVVADGSSQVTLKAELVDQNGNIVGNATGNVALYYTTHGGATSIVTPSVPANPMNVTQALQEGTAAAVTQGVATFKLQSGLVAGQSDTLYAAMYTGGGTIVSSPTAAQITLTSTAEQPSSLSITAPTYLAANADSQAAAKIQVLDQAGAPMLFGSAPIAVSLQGPATFGNGSSGQQGYLYTGSGNPSLPASVSVPIQAVQGQTGNITLTASATGIQAATATIEAVVAGPATAIQVTPPSTASFPESSYSTGLTFGVAVVDAHGYPVTSNQVLEIRVDKNGSVANNIKIDGYVQSSSGVLDDNALTNGHFTVTDTGSGANAGSYTISVTDPNGKLSAAAPVTFTETPGQVTQVVATAPQYVPLSDPTVTVTATLEDAYDNVVPVTGTILDFANASTNPAPGVTLSSPSATTVDGVATVTATAPVYVGTTYSVQVSGTGFTPQDASFTVENTVAGNLTVSFRDTYQGGDSTGTYAVAHSTTTAEASDTVQIIVTAADQYGNAVKNEPSSTVNLQFSGKGLVPEYSTGGALNPIGTNEWSTTLGTGGTVTITAIAEQAGVVGVTATDTSISGGSTGAGNFSVVPGRFWGYQVLDTSGNNTATNNETVLANTPVELIVTPVDEYGNETTLTTAQTVRLSDGSNGTFSLTAGGSPITSFQLAAGQSQQVIYYQNSVAGAYHITAY